MRKPAFCIWENKDADQLCGNRAAGQRLCFRYIDSTIFQSQISSLDPSSVVVEPGLCWTWSETQKTDFLMMQLKLNHAKFTYLSQPLLLHVLRLAEIWVTRDRIAMI